MRKSLAEITSPIEPELKQFQRQFREALKSKAPLLDRITMYIVRRKGKQMRPMFIFLSAKLFGEATPSSFRAASLVELLHTATLVHDDVVDESLERRGFFSVNALWKNKAAVLVGDYLLSRGLLLALEHISRGGRRFHPTTTRHPALRPVRLTGWRQAAALLACGLPLMIGFVIPAGALLWLLVQAGDPFSPARYLPFARNSLVLSGITAVLAVLLAAGMAWAARLYPSPARSIANRVASLGYALPGSVIAVGVLVPFGLFDNALDSWLRARFGVSSGLLLSGTMAALVFAYLVRFLAVALSTVESGLARLKPSYTDAARVLGRRPGQAVREVEVPLARGALLTAGLLVFVDTMKELPATLIVRPFDLDTLAVRVYNLASDERLAEASTAAVLIVLVGLLPVAALTRMMRRE